jgi:uncharacterized membrane protein
MPAAGSIWRSSPRLDLRPAGIGYSWEEIVMRGSFIVASAVAATLAGAGMTAGTVGAAENEKCYGVAAASQNDCQTSTNSCAGQAAEAGRGDAWIYVPTGTCQKINGGTLEPKQS